MTTHRATGLEHVTHVRVIAPYTVEVTFEDGMARRIDMTGGHIRQITLRAAFVAAASDTPISIEHIAHACRAELAKLGMPPMELEAAERRNAA